MDLKAARNAIALNTSNSIVEGFVNKLKAVKRIMYGWASLAQKKNGLWQPMLQLIAEEPNKFRPLCPGRTQAHSCECASLSGNRRHDSKNSLETSVYGCNP